MCTCGSKGQGEDGIGGDGECEDAITNKCLREGVEADLFSSAVARNACLFLRGEIDPNAMNRVIYLVR